MSKYLTLIPLLREMCFPTIIPGWWRKNDYGKLKFLSFFGQWGKVIWSWNNPLLDFFLHFISITGFYFLLLFLTWWRKTFLYNLSIIGFISVFMVGDKMAGHFTWPPLTSPPPARICLYFSLYSFQTYSSQYLPVLSKCYCKVFQWDDSKYVYINRGNTLGYILLTSCVVFLYHLI